MELTMSSHISIQTTSTDCQFASAFSQYTFNPPRIQYIATPSSGANLELLLPIGILSFAMKDSRCDVWARAHAMGGGRPKRPVATSRVTYREGVLKVWSVTER